MNNGKICVSVCAETADQMIAKIRRAGPLADVIEVRFDCLDPAEVQKTVDALPKVNSTYLLTFRPQGQGGRREIAFSERLEFWESISSLQSQGFIIDIEAEPEIASAVATNRSPRVVSHHNIDGDVADTDAVLDAMRVFEAEVYKIAITAADATAAIALWRSFEKAAATAEQVIPIAMGEAGKWTRILGLAHGAYMTYASLDKGEETAGGQITAKELIEVYRVKELDQDTAVYGVIGDPVSSSLSPYLHNAGFAATGLNAAFLPLQVKDLDEFVRRLVAPGTREIELNFAGFSVTMPHKQAIIKHLDEIDVVAEKIRAVNTVRIENGKLLGYNTDAHGFLTPLNARGIELKRTKVAILGAGGAARACVYALESEGADVTIFARDAQKARAIVSETGVTVRSLSFCQTDESEMSDFDIVVNATPLGMKGEFENASPLTANHLKGVKFVYDLVTRSGDTPLIAAAKKAGAATINGVEMLISQGLRQFEIWTGREAPTAVMRQSVADRLAK